MQTAGENMNSESFIGAQLPTGEALSAAFLALKQQLVDQSSVCEKKSNVIRLQQARIAVLEEQLQLNKIERFGASSESNPLQQNFFNEAELLGDDEDSQGKDVDADQAKPPKARGTRKGLNPNIPRVQERLLLTDGDLTGSTRNFSSNVVYAVQTSAEACSISTVVVDVG